MKEDSIFSLDADLNNLWVWCLSKASHINTKWDFIVKGKGKIFVELLPGQFVCGRHSMAKSLGANPSTTWKRLKMLESHGFISIKSDKKYSVVTILNWDSYKDTKFLKEQVSEQDTELDCEQETRQQHDTKKNVKNVKNVKNDIYSQFFDEIWSKYPKRDGKRDALRHFSATVKSDKDVEDIRKALSNYLQSDTVKNGYIKNGSTWFHNWRDWIDNPVDNLKSKKWNEI